MALAGLHVVCSYAGGRTDDIRTSPIPVPGPPISSETLATPGTTTLTAGERINLKGDPLFTIRCSQPAWIAVGPNPNANVNPRKYIDANIDYDMFVNPGSKLAWIAA